MNSVEAAMEEGSLHMRHHKPPALFAASDLMGVTEFLNIDSDLWIFRRFGKLHLFNILCMQQNLALLEDQLDRQISFEEPTNFDQLLPTIKHALCEYGMPYENL